MHAINQELELELYAPSFKCWHCQSDVMLSWLFGTCMLQPSLQADPSPLQLQAARATAYHDRSPMEAPAQSWCLHTVLSNYSLGLVLCSGSSEASLQGPVGLSTSDYGLGHSVPEFQGPNSTLYSCPAYQSVVGFEAATYLAGINSFKV